MKPIKSAIVLLFRLLLFCLPVADCAGQDDDAEERLIAETADRLGEAPEEADDLAMHVRRSRKIHVNTVTEQELRELGLLTELQMISFLNYRTAYGMLYSRYELAYVDGFDDEAVALLLPYLSFHASGPLSAGLLQEAGKHELFVRSQRVIESQAGYRGEYPYYRGSPVKLFTRYTYCAGDGLQVGFTAEKDAGEQLFRGGQPGFDYFSGYTLFTGKGAVRQVIAGDYHLLSGQGLVLWSGFAFSGVADPGRAARYGRGIRPHTGAEENRFLRGAAVRLQHKNLFFVPFYSSKKVDANRTSGSTFRSFQTSGYHRSGGELKDKDAVLERFAGISIGYRSHRTAAVLTGMHYGYDAALQPPEEAYRLYRFRGRTGSAAGLAYERTAGKSIVFGEAAVNAVGGMATLNGFSLQPDSRVSFSLLCRTYSRAYHAPYGSAYGRATGNQNETGIYAGLAVTPAPAWKLSFSSDLYRFPWLTYLVNGPSEGYDHRAGITHQLTRGCNLELHLRRTGKATGIIGAGAVRPVFESRRTNLRLHARFPLSESLAFSVRYESVQLASAAETERGYLVYQDVLYKGRPGPLSASVRFTVFDIPSYDSRIYAYESDLLYVLSVPSHHYRGIRYYVNLSCRLHRSVHLWVKLGRTRYLNRNQAGSGYDATPGPGKSEIRAQIRYRF